MYSGRVVGGLCLVEGEVDRQREGSSGPVVADRRVWLAPKDATF